MNHPRLVSHRLSHVPIVPTPCTTPDGSDEMQNSNILIIVYSNTLQFSSFHTLLYLLFLFDIRIFYMILLFIALYEEQDFVLVMAV